MHILIPTGIFHPESGGPATYLYHLIPALIAQGHTVQVITFSDHVQYDDPYPVVRIPRRNLLRRNWDYYWAVRRHLPKADVVYVNSLGLPLPQISQPSIMKIVGDFAWERAIRRGWIPLDEDIDQFQTKNYNVLVNWLKRGRARDAQAMDQIIVPSEYLRQMVIGWGISPEKIQVIYNAFDPQSPPLTPANRHALGLPDHAPLLLTVARLTAWKGIDATLEAIRDLPDVHYVIAGDGPEMQKLQQLASDLDLNARVHFLGKVPHDKLAEYYAVADYKVLYSGYEGLSHVLLEALYYGTPIIASDKGGNPEVVQPNVNGFLVPYRDVGALRHTIQQAIVGDTRQNLSPQLDLSRFAWQHLVEETLAVFEKMR